MERSSIGDMSRRTFLAGIAAAPMAGALGESHPEGRKLPRVVVVGAGAFGGWTALQLRRLGADVELVDAWGAGNSRSSSGGETRAIRAIYGGDRIYVEMVRRSFELWEEISAQCGSPLYVETGVLWMVRDGDAYVRAALPILEENGFSVDSLPLETAKTRYPQIRFDGVSSVWLERRAGMLAARRGCVSVREAFEKKGGKYRTGRVMPVRIENGSIVSLQLEDGASLEADAFVFACGPWLGQVVPELLGEAIRPTRQEVHFFGVPPGASQFDPRQLPVWIDFGPRILYGMPDFDGRGFKVADDTRGPAFDPTSGDRTPTKEGIARARELLALRFPALADAALLESRVCQYENSPDGHLIVDRHPGARNAWIAGGGSGHGYKLAPAVGELVANAVAIGSELPAMFGIERLERAGASATQFDHRS